MTIYRRLLLLAALPCFATSVLACPFCENLGKTFTQNAEESDWVAVATLSQAKQRFGAVPGESTGTTEMEIQRLLKPHTGLEDGATVELPEFRSEAQDAGGEFLVFGVAVDGILDVTRTLALDGPELPNYLEAGLAASRGKPAERLGFYFDYLDHVDSQISTDAYKEFARAPYTDVEAANSGFERAKLIEWIGDRRTEQYRLGLYGLLLGLSGKPEDAALLRDLVASPLSRPETGLDGLLGGYCLLEPDKGPGWVLELLIDDAEDFALRYAALRTIRFLLDEKLVDEPDRLLANMVPVLTRPELSDLVIKELRNRKCWSLDEDVLAVWDVPECKHSFIRREIVGYALRCPTPEAREFVRQRRADATLITRDVEELVRYDEVLTAAQPANVSPGQVD